MTLQLEIPLLTGFSSRRFQPAYQQQITNQSGGFLQTLDRSTPMWYAEYQTPPLNAARENATWAFLDQLEGSLETFLAYDPRRPLPFNYLKSSLSSNPLGTALSVASYNSGTGALSIQGGPANVLGFSARDYISCKVGNIWCLFRLSAVATSTFSAGGVQNVTVKPRVPITIPAGTAIRYVKACFEAKIIGGIQETDSVESLPVLAFKAYQFINRT